MLRRLALACVLLAAGCGDDGMGPGDAGVDARVDGGALDAGPADGGDDAGMMDAGSDDAGDVDAGPDAGLDGGPDAGLDATTSDGGGPGACNPGAVEFPMGGSLTPGTLCDEVYACATDAADVARIEAASSRFMCTPGPEPGSDCTAFTCSYRDPGGPSTLDEDEIAEICKVTVLEPTPPMRCVVFL